MPLPVPRELAEITADWLTDALRANGTINCAVDAFELSSVGEELGLLSTVGQVSLHYDAPSGGEPRSVIVKIETLAGAFRQSAEKAHAFEREIRFYTQVAPKLPLRIPRFYYGGLGDEGGVLVLEDLSHLTQHNQIVGLSNENALKAVRQGAKLHAHFWDRAEALDAGWMLKDDDRLFFNVDKNWELFESLYSLRLGKDAMELGHWISHNLPTLKQAMSERIHTVCHGDFRADNLLYGSEGSEEETVVIDWQLTTRAMGALDIARLIGGSEPEMERRAHHEEAVRCWHEALLQHGVTGYDYTHALDDFRLAAIANLAVPIRLCSVGQSEPGRIGRLVDAMAERLFASALEIDAVKALP